MRTPQGKAPIFAGALRGIDLLTVGAGVADGANEDTVALPFRQCRQLGLDRIRLACLIGRGFRPERPPAIAGGQRKQGRRRGKSEETAHDRLRCAINNVRQGEGLRHAVAPASAPYRPRRLTLSILPVPSLGSGSSTNQIRAGSLNWARRSARKAR